MASALYGDIKRKGGPSLFIRQEPPAPLPCGRWLAVPAASTAWLAFTLASSLYFELSQIEVPLHPHPAHMQAAARPVWPAGLGAGWEPAALAAGCS